MSPLRFAMYVNCWKYAEPGLQRLTGQQHVITVIPPCNGEI